MLTRGAAWGGFGLFRSRDSNTGIAVLGAVVVSLVVYAVSFFLLRLLSRYRELAADRAGAYLTMRPAALASALQKISGEMAAIPQKDLRASQAMNAFFIAPADLRRHPEDPDRHPPLARAAAGAAGPDPGRARPAPAVTRVVGIWDAITGRSRVKANNLDALFNVPNAAITLQTAAGLMPTGTGSVCFRSAAGAAFAETRNDVVELIRSDASAPEVEVTDDGFGYTWLVVHRVARRRRGPVHRPARREHQPGGPGLRLRAAVLGGPVRGPSPADGSAWSTSTSRARSTPSRRQPGDAQVRDNLLEISVRDQLAGELPMESDLSRWFALWGAPGL